MRPYTTIKSIRVLPSLLPLSRAGRGRSLGLQLALYPRTVARRRILLISFFHKAFLKQAWWSVHTDKKQLFRSPGPSCSKDG